MIPNTKKKARLGKRAKIRFPQWFQHFILYFYKLSLFHIGAIVVLLIIVVNKGDLFSKEGLTLVGFLLVYLILLYFKTLMKKNDES